MISRNICTSSEVSTPPNLPLARGGAVGGGVTLVFSYLEIAQPVPLYADTQNHSYKDNSELFGESTVSVNWQDR